MQELTKTYRDIKGRYESFNTSIHDLIKKLLQERNLKYHIIEARTKEPERLDEKITRKGEKYQSLDDITDLVGIRIITYFEDDVEKIAEAIKSEFDVDKENSIDKRQLDSDRFGYRSLHYVISMRNQRLDLFENKNYRGLKAEIQIRSLLQHAWAEIEHGIGYKGQHSIPDVLKRNFYRVAALLETADIEFVNIRDKSQEYAQSVPEAIEKHPESVEINYISMQTFVAKSPLVEEIDQRIAAEIGAIYYNEGMANSLVERVQHVGIQTIDELDTLLQENKEYIIKFAKAWVSRPAMNFLRGISIFYLCYIIIAQKKDPTFAHMYLYRFTSFTMGRSSDDIFKIYNKILDEK